MVCFLQISKKRSIRDNLLRLLETTEDVEESFEASTQSNVTNNSDDSKGRCLLSYVFRQVEGIIIICFKWGNFKKYLVHVVDS